MKLQGMQLVEEIVVGYNSTDASQKDKNGKPFRVLVHNKIPFTVPEPIFQEWQAGNLRSLNLIEDTRKIEVAAEDGTVTEQTVPSLTFAGAATNDQMYKLHEFEAKIEGLKTIRATGSLAGAVA